MFYLKNWSQVVPQCMNELAITVAEWQTEFRTASCSIKTKHILQNLYSGKTNKNVARVYGIPNTPMLKTKLSVDILENKNNKDMPAQLSFNSKGGTHVRTI